MLFQTLNNKIFISFSLSFIISYHTKKKVPKALSRWNRTFLFTARFVAREMMKFSCHFIYETIEPISVVALHQRTRNILFDSVFHSVTFKATPRQTHFQRRSHFCSRQYNESWPSESIFFRNSEKIISTQPANVPTKFPSIRAIQLPHVLSIFQFSPPYSIVHRSKRNSKG